MPNRDMTGPEGLGPKTGRGMGPCSEEVESIKKGPAARATMQLRAKTTRMGATTYNAIKDKPQPHKLIHKSANSFDLHTLLFKSEEGVKHANALENAHVDKAWKSLGGEKGAKRLFKSMPTPTERELLHHLKAVGGEKGARRLLKAIPTHAQLEEIQAKLEERGETELVAAVQEITAKATDKEVYRKVKKLLKGLPPEKKVKVAGRRYWTNDKGHVFRQVGSPVGGYAYKRIAMSLDKLA